MSWTHEKWNSYSPDVIENCFTLCLKNADRETTDIIAKNALKNTEHNANEYGVSCEKVSLDNLLNPDAHDIIVTQVTFESLVDEIIEDMSDVKLSDDEGIEEFYNEKVFVVEAYRIRLEVANTSEEMHDMLDLACSQVFVQCQRDLRIQKQASTKKTTIMQYFGPK